jgi:hypothetical protein
MIEDKREGLVGASGFQPLTSWIPTRQSKGLRTVNRATTVFETVVFGVVSGSEGLRRICQVQAICDRVGDVVMTLCPKSVVTQVGIVLICYV